ncbi:MAG: VOC family protein, partial [Alphaproteobacteria bacterium]|nr:VOC family protein [Alphaproteobacteria bacterium]
MFWIVQPDVDIAPSRGSHVGFAAPNSDAVDAFHAAAMAAGARDNGGPGMRPQYSENYYGAFVLDPDGHKIEAMCRSAV